MLYFYPILYVGLSNKSYCNLTKCGKSSRDMKYFCNAQRLFFHLADSCASLAPEPDFLHCQSTRFFVLNQRLTYPKLPAGPERFLVKSRLPPPTYNVTLHIYFSLPLTMHQEHFCMESYVVQTSPSAGVLPVFFSSCGSCQLGSSNLDRPIPHCRLDPLSRPWLSQPNSWLSTGSGTSTELAPDFFI